MAYSQYIYIKDAKHWIRLGVETPEEAKKWINIGLDSPDRVERWMDEGIETPQIAKKWIDANFNNIGKIHTWIYSGVSRPEEVQQWINIGLNYQQFKEWKDKGVSNVKEVTVWLKLGVKNAYAMEQWRNAGAKTAFEVEKWMNLGVTNARDLTQLKENGVKTIEELKVRNQQNANSQRYKELYQYWLKISVIIFIVVSAYGIFLGFTDRAVFYIDSKDIFVSFVPVGILIMSFIVSVIFDIGNWFKYVIGIVFILTLLFEINKLNVYNKKYIKTIPVVFAKILLSILALIGVKSYTDSLKKDGRVSSGYRDGNTTFIFILFLGLFGLLVNKLINGDRIQNYELSEDNETRHI